MLSFGERLAEAVRRRGTSVLVGLDPRIEQLPEIVRKRAGDSASEQAAAYREFCQGVIDVVAPLVPAVKPQAAFFEELGPAGMQALADVIRYARDRGLLVIVDGKRNDIGSTATAYARAYLGAESSAWGADALTVSPYLGADSIEPFVEVGRQRGAGIFVLVKTSNSGGGQFQDLACEGRPLYRHVAEFVERLATAGAGASGYGDVGAVVGATWPEQLAELRQAMPHAWLLIPGFGSQGGTAQHVAAGFDSRGLGAIVNNSRGIIFAHARPEFAGRFKPAEWQQAVEAATREMIAQLPRVASGK
ncbi:MAG TPA: orotidine-5'-phosphate decarboxylase [Pirellulales bacterium]|jgi:orotidine-5'-phosphate decarboxylase|nr:orotidine-5'-phosphate decarboxylase [Pirellulales bacterium]